MTLKEFITIITEIYVAYGDIPVTCRGMCPEINPEVRASIRGNNPILVLNNERSKSNESKE